MTVCARAESYEASARRLAVGSELCFGGTVARLALVSSGGGVCHNVRVFTAHTEGDLRPAWLWIPWRQALERVAHHGIPELELFVQGYLEGWIPDGWITLTGESEC